MPAPRATCRPHTSVQVERISQRENWTPTDRRPKRRRIHARQRKPTVLVVLGSPRKRGNSAILAAQIASGAEASRGHHQYALSYMGSGSSRVGAVGSVERAAATGCAIQDRECSRCIGQMAAADAWVIASPVYWFSGLRPRRSSGWTACLALPAYGNDPSPGSVSRSP